MEEFKVQVANEGHKHLAEAICKEMEESAKARGTGIAKRNPDYIRQKMEEGKAIIATSKSGEFAGFSTLRPGDTVTMYLIQGSSFLQNFVTVVWLPK